MKITNGRVGNEEQRIKSIKNKEPELQLLEISIVLLKLMQLH